MTNPETLGTKILLHTSEDYERKLRVAILRAVIASLKENGYSKTVKLVDSLFKNFFFKDSVIRFKFGLA